VDEFTDALRRVATGGSVLDPDVVAALLTASSSNDPLLRTWNQPPTTTAASSPYSPGCEPTAEVHAMR
jgi:hypothetical protein